MGLRPGVAGSPGSGGSNGVGGAGGVVSAALGGADVAVRVDGGAPGCGAQGSAAGFGVGSGFVSDAGAESAAGAAALGVGSVASLVAGVLPLAAPPGTRTTRMGKGFGGGSAAGVAGTSVPVEAAACDLSCPSSARMRCS